MDSVDKHVCMQIVKTWMMQSPAPGVLPIGTDRLPLDF